MGNNDLLQTTDAQKWAREFVEWCYDAWEDLNEQAMMKKEVSFLQEKGRSVGRQFTDLKFHGTEQTFYEIERGSQHEM